MNIGVRTGFQTSLLRAELYLICYRVYAHFLKIEIVLHNDYL